MGGPTYASNRGETSLSTVILGIFSRVLGTSDAPETWLQPHSAVGECFGACTRWKLPERKITVKVVPVFKTEGKEESGLCGPARLAWIPRKSVRLRRVGSCPYLFNIFIINMGNGMENTFVKLTGDKKSGGTADSWGRRTRTLSSDNLDRLKW